MTESMPQTESLSKCVAFQFSLSATRYTFCESRKADENDALIMAKIRNCLSPASSREIPPIYGSNTVGLDRKGPTILALYKTTVSKKISTADHQITQNIQKIDFVFELFMLRWMRPTKSTVCEELITSVRLGYLGGDG